MNPSTEVKNAVLRLYESMGTGNVAAIERLFSRESGALAIGSDPDEWWAGQDTIAAAFRAQLQGMGTRRIVPGDLKAFAEGTVGWAADRRTIRLADGRVMIVRETFVLHMEDGEWRIVQSHASVAISNTEAFGRERAAD